MSITPSFWRLHGSGKLSIAKMKKLSCMVAIGGFLWLTGVGQNAGAATQLLAYDFESGTLSSVFTLNVPTASNTISSAQVHAGTRALFYNPSAGSTSGSLAAPITPSTTVYAKWWWWVPSTIVGGSGRHGFRVTRRVGDQFTPHWEVDSVIGTGGGFGIDVLFHDDGVDSGTIYHNLFNLPTNQWFLFELLYTLNTPGTANGVMTFWVNGTQRFTASKVLYRASGSSMSGFDTFLLTTNFDGAGAGSYWYMDDVQVWDSVPTGGGPPPPTNLRVQ